MPIVTLTTDWNSEDYFVGLFKGKILSRCIDINIVDITHRVNAFNTSQAAFIIRNSYIHFPPGTIHVVFVNSEPSDKNPFLLVKANRHFFIGTDNGIFDLIINEEPEFIMKININNDFTSYNSYSAFDVFSNTVCDLAEGKDLSLLGEPVKDYQRRTPIRPTIDESVITGRVIYIDSFMNAITNITRELFERVGMSRPFEIYVQSKHYRITSINRFYHESPVGELLAIFNSAGLLEIAINSGNVAGLLNLDANSTIRVEFKDKK